MLRASRGEASGPRDPLGRRSSAHLVSDFRPILLGSGCALPGWAVTVSIKPSPFITSVMFGLSPIPPSGKAAGRQGRRFEEPQKLGPFGFGLSSNSVRFGLRAPRVGRRLSAQARRFYEPQKHGQQLGLNHDQKFSPILLSSGCGVRPGHQRCPAASPATLWVARAQPLCYELRPRRAPHAPLKRRPRRGRRFCESRYSLLV